MVARQRNETNERRIFRAEFRLTKTESELLLNLSKSVGLTPSDYIRFRTIGSRPQIKKATPEREAFIKALGELGKIGSNVNQIARVLNQHKTQVISNEIIGASLHSIQVLSARLINMLDKNVIVNGD